MVSGSMGGTGGLKEGMPVSMMACKSSRILGTGLWVAGDSLLGAEVQCSTLVHALLHLDARVCQGQRQE